MLKNNVKSTICLIVVMIIFKWFIGNNIDGLSMSKEVFIALVFVIVYYFFGFFFLENRGSFYFSIYSFPLYIFNLIFEFVIYLFNYNEKILKVMDMLKIYNIFIPSLLLCLGIESKDLVSKK